MKNITQIFLSVLVLLSFACQSPEVNKIESKKAKQQVKNKKGSVNKKSKKANQAKKQTPKYIDLLAKELKLNAAQKAGVSKINNEFNTEKQQLLKRHKTKKLSKQQTLVLNKQRNEKFKKLIGEELLKRKQEFDVKRRKK